jgi:hypothetical protein
VSNKLTHSQAPARSDLIRGLAEQMVRTHEAPDFRTACSILGKRAASVRQRHKRNRERAAQMWYNRD